LVGALSRSLGAARRKAGEFALVGAEGRLADLLLRLVRGSGKPAGAGHARVTLVYSRRELAEMIGVSTETAIRLLARLKQKRLIDTDHHDVIVTDLGRLARVANHTP
jgi:CRP-like cAMP-binding protein